MVNISLKQLEQEYSTCQSCSELCKSRTQIIFGSGKIDSKILFIGEAPGATEDKEGIPFCGASGKILSELLKSINLTRDDVFITNTVLCRPPKNRNPKIAEIKNCKDRLDQTIEIINPKVIVTIGNFATKAILGQANITKIRGQVFNHEFRGKNYHVIPVIHPANLLYNGRNNDVLEAMKKDFQVIKKTMQK